MPLRSLHSPVFSSMCNFKKKNLCEYTVAVFTHQKRVLDPITDGCEPPRDCWELNSGPLEERLTTEPSPAPPPPPWDPVLRMPSTNHLFHNKILMVFH